MALVAPVTSNHQNWPIVFAGDAHWNFVGLLILTRAFDAADGPLPPLTSPECYAFDGTVLAVRVQDPFWQQDFRTNATPCLSNSALFA